MSHLLIVHDQPVTGLVAGPSLRYYELATALARHHEVTLAVPELSDLPARGFRAVTFRHETRESLLPLVAHADALLVSWYLLAGFPQLSARAKALIVDIYIPAPFEDLELHRDKPTWQRSAMIEQDFEKIKMALRAGDFFVCGNEPQRDFWLGMLGAHGRLNPLNYEADATFRQLVDVVSMGIPDAQPDAGLPLKGKRKGIAAGDFLLVWPGGLWDWLDPLTAVESVRLVRDRVSDVKLLFPGLRHPQPEAVSFMKNPDAVLALVRRHDLGAHVLFDEWTPYRERSRYLLAADAALSLHFPTVETHMAIRARLLDCIWTGTPVIGTAGDVIVEAMAERGLAKLVPPKDAEALAEAILESRNEPGRREALAVGFRELAEEYRWSRVSRPLVDYLTKPVKARDREVDLARQMPPAKRWLSESLLALPFDQYQRHREAAEVIETLRGAASRLAILDVGGGPGLLAGFLDQQDSVIVLDRHSGGGESFVIGDAARMPFADGSFDFAVALDVLEHIPPGDRLLTIDECLRVAKQGLVLTAPFARAETVAAERQLFEFIKAALGVEQLQLAEHAANGLPEQAEIEAHLAAGGHHYLLKPSGYLQRWLAMMLLKHYLMSLPDSAGLHRNVDRYYNQHFSLSDRRSPSYRLLWYVSKTKSSQEVERVARALDEPTDEIAVKQALTLSQLGLGDGQLAAQRLADISREQMIGQLLEHTAERCAVAESELAAYKDLLERMQRRKIVRVMRGIDGLARKFRKAI